MKRKTINMRYFRTTSSYIKEDFDFGTYRLQKSIKVIDGELLADYMVKYGTGVESVKTFNTYKINSDYFKQWMSVSPGYKDNTTIKKSY